MLQATSELRVDVPLLLHDACPLQWEIAPGCRPVGDRDTGYYEPDAVVPLTFRAPLEEEARCYATRSVGDVTLFTTVVPVSPQPCRDLGEHFQAWKHGRDDEARGEFALREVVASLSEHLAWAGSIAYLGIFEDAPGMLTVARDPASQLRRTGLHVDTGKRASDKVAVNLGESPRSFLWIPYSWPQMLERHPSGQNSRQVLRMFRLALPVVRVTVPPFHAYVAPTTRIVHDGCTESSDRSLANATFKGRFVFRGDGAGSRVGHTDTALGGPR
ncbi:MAG: hypothetical protein ACYDHH_16545 [Solirubrobacteraceae bacterium]